jgi:hypothetical protein
MSGTFDQVDGPKLGKGTAAGTTGETTEVNSILWDVGDIFTCAINGDHPQTQSESASGSPACQWLATGPKQLTDGSDSQLVASIRQRTVSWHPCVRVGPQQTDSPRQLAQDSCDCQAGKEAQSDHDAHDRALTDDTLSLFPRVAASEDLFDTLGGNNLFKDMQQDLLAHLVISLKVTYAKSHQECPFIWPLISRLIRVCHMKGLLFFSSYLNGIDPLRLSLERHK